MPAMHDQKSKDPKSMLEKMQVILRKIRNIVQEKNCSLALSLAPPPPSIYPICETKSGVSNQVKDRTSPAQWIMFYIGIYCVDSVIC